MLSGSRVFSLKWELEDAEGLSSFLAQHYGGDATIPDDLLLPLELEDRETLAELLTEIRGRRVTLTVPRRGTKRELVELAGKNAAAALRERDERQASTETLLEELRQKLHLGRTPRRIECYDISTIQGRFSVGSGVAFSDGAADKGRYRRYRIRQVAGQDDFAMLKEVFGRRFAPEKIEQEGLPDLVVVDGGIGQLNSVQEIVTELGLTGRFDLVSLAKSRTGRDAQSAEIEKSAERVFLPGRRNPVVLKQNSRPLLLLAEIRDEAHRFAIGYHRILRGKEGIASGIEEIPGIGGKRSQALLRQFGSLQGVREATVEQLAEVPGMNRASAEKLYAALHGK
jgi:excinuclease ABC subunit C